MISCATVCRCTGIKAAATTLALSLLVAPLEAQQLSTVARPFAPANVAFRIDGRVDEEAWSAGRAVPLALETRPLYNVAARVRTDCRIVVTDAHLYLGCVAADPHPSEIRAQYVERDLIESHDRISLYLDTFDDGQRAFVFHISPLGIQADAAFDQTSGQADLSWNAAWRSAGRINPDGFSIEAAIPLSSLRYPTGSNRLWRFFIERAWPRTEVVTMRSSARDESNSCLLCDSERLEAPIAESGRTNVQLTPSLTAIRTDRSIAPGERLLAGPTLGDVGMDLRWGVTSGLAVAATVNPDFSQVEADAVQIETNNRFALFFPERRDFFLQENELFATPLRTFFTRSIADPIAGLKATGRSGVWAGGLLAVRDEQTALLIPGPFGSDAIVLDQPSDVLVARGSRAVGASSRLGALFTNRSGAGYQNTVVGVDAFLRPMAPVEVQLQALQSRTTYPDSVRSRFSQPAGALNGASAFANAVYSSRPFNLRLRVESKSDELRADAGFLTQVGTKSAEGSFSRKFWANGQRWFTRFEWNGGTWHSRTQRGGLIESGGWTSGNYFGPYQTTLSVNPFTLIERFAGATYRRWGLNVSASARPTVTLGTSVRMYRGAEVDYENARLADVGEWDGTVDMRVGRRTSFEATASERALRRGSRPIVRERLGRVVTRYGFSNRFHLRLLGQARQVVRNPAAYSRPVDAKTVRLESQAVLSYRLDGQTSGFLGYSSLAADSRGEGVPLVVRPQSTSVFLKLSYAWRP